MPFSTHAGFYRDFTANALFPTVSAVSPLPNRTTGFNAFTNLLREKIRENFHHAGELHGAAGNRGLSFAKIGENF